MHRSGTITGLLVAALALAVPATGSAKSTPKVKLRAVGAPPSKATAPGSAFTLRGRLVNTSRATQRPKLTITLRRTKTSAARKVATKRLRRVKPGRSLRYSVRVKLPSGLATGNYYVRTCALGACRFSSRRVKVRRPSTPKPPATTPIANRRRSPARRTPFDVLVFTSRRRSRRRRRSTRVRDLGPTERLRRHRRPATRPRSPRPTSSATAPSCSLGNIGDVAQRRPGGRVRGLLQGRRRLPRRRRRDRDRAGLGVPDRAARHARRRRGRRRRRTRRSRSPTAATRRASDAAGVLDAAATASTTSRATSAASRTCSPRSTRRPTPAAR